MGKKGQRMSDCSQVIGSLSLRATMFFIMLSITCFQIEAEGRMRLSPSLDLSTEYNDNIYWMREKESDIINRIGPAISLSIPGYHKELTLGYSAGFEFFVKNTDENTVTHRVNGEASYRATERLNLKLADTYVRSKSLSEIELYGLRRRRESYWQNSLTPSLDYTFGPNRVLSLGYRYIKSQFETYAYENSTEHSGNIGLRYGLNPHNILTLNYMFTHGQFAYYWGNLNRHLFELGYEYIISPRTSIIAGTSYIRSDYTGIWTIDYQIYSAFLGLTRVITPYLNLSAKGGYFIQDPEVGNSSSGFLGDFAINYSRGRTRLGLSGEKGYTEVLFTTENLGFSTYWRILANASRDIFRHWRIEVLGSYTKNHYTYAHREDRFWTTGANISYSPVKWFRGMLSYEHTRLDTTWLYEGYSVNRVILSLYFVY